MVEVVQDSAKVADAVTVAVGEAARVDLVDHGGLPPVAPGDGAGRTSVWTQGAAQRVTRTSPRPCVTFIRNSQPAWPYKVVIVSCPKVRPSHPGRAVSETIRSTTRLALVGMFTARAACGGPACELHHPAGAAARAASSRKRPVALPTMGTRALRPASPSRPEPGPRVGTRQFGEVALHRIIHPPAHPRTVTSCGSAMSRDLYCFWSRARVGHARRRLSPTQRRRRSLIHSGACLSSVLEIPLGEVPQHEENLRAAVAAMADLACGTRRRPGPDRQCIAGFSGPGIG